MLSNRKQIAFVGLIIGACLVLEGCSSRSRYRSSSSKQAPSYTVAQSQLSKSLQSCQANLNKAQSELNSCMAVQPDANKLKQRLDNIQRSFNSEKNKVRKLESILEELDRRVNEQSYLIESDKHLEGLISNEKANLKKYFDIKEGKGSSVGSLLTGLFGNAEEKRMMSWEPEYLEKKITEANTNIRVIHFALMLKSNQAINYKELMRSKIG